MKCPFCAFESGEYVLRQHAAKHSDWQKVELFVMYADMIPKSKVAALIKECGLNEVDYQNNLGTYETRARYKVLKELLNDTKVE